MRHCQSRTSISASTRSGAVVAFVTLLAAACSGGDTAPKHPDATIAVSPPTTATLAESRPLLAQPATEARPIASGNGQYPSAGPGMPAADLPAAVEIGPGRIWVPWPAYAETDDGDGASGSTTPVGSQSALRDDAAIGHSYVVAQRSQWQTMPPYAADARAALADGTRIARRRAGVETAWELAVDLSGLEYGTRLTADSSAAFDHVTLCPPHPTAEALGIEIGSTAAERDRAGTVIEAFIMGMRSPGGRPIHSWGTTTNDVAKLLVYSPGEPMELALGGHSLTDVGFFPGDWSAQAETWLTRRAAQGAVTDSLVGHAVVSRGPGTLWEACSDLATITAGVYTASHRTRQLESLWARGLRLEFTSPPVERAWVADLSAAGHALAVLCHEPGRSYLVDASNGERLDAGRGHPAQVEAMWLTWSRLSYRVLANALFDGACDSDAFVSAVQWLASEKRAHDETIDWTDPRAWGSGVHNLWIPVREWVAVPQAEAWQAHRDHRWHLAFWCETGIPVGAIVGNELQRPELAAHCTHEQWSALAGAAAAAPHVTWELSATKWAPGASWHERMYLSPFKTLADVLGCSTKEAGTAEGLARAVEQRVKKPWPPGSLPLTPADQAYPRPMPPCPQAEPPPQVERYWRPAALPLSELPADAWAQAHAGVQAEASSGAS